MKRIQIPVSEETFSLWIRYTTCFKANMIEPDLKEILEKKLALIEEPVKGREND